MNPGSSGTPPFKKDIEENIVIKRREEKRERERE
jgi:hypothetical protein